MSRHPEILDRLATQLHIQVDQITHEHLRSLAVDGLFEMATQGRLDHIPNINDYISGAMEDRTWADGPIIAAIAKRLRLTIVLVNSNTEDPTVIHEGNAGKVFLGYQSGIHFVSLQGVPNARFLDYVDPRAIPGPVGLLPQ
jgi:hypothetical protein